MVFIWSYPQDEIIVEKSYYIVFLVYNEAIREEVLSIIRKYNIESYDIVESIINKPRHGEPRLKDDVWPGEGEMLSFICDSSLKEKVKKDIIEFNKNVVHENEIIKLYTSKIEDLVY